MSGLAEGLVHMRHLNKLDVSYNNLTSNGIITLIKAIGNNLQMTTYLEELDVSGNDCGTYGTVLDIHVSLYRIISISVFSYLSIAIILTLSISLLLFSSPVLFSSLLSSPLLISSLLFPSLLPYR